MLSRVKPGISPFIEKFAPPVPPNVFIFLSLPLALLAAWAMTVSTVLGGAMVLFTAFFDALDGAAARKYGKVTRTGGYLDAMVDRYVEIILWFGIGYSTGLWPLSLLSLALSLTFSYAKARVALETPVSNLGFPDPMERSERLLYTGLALLLSPWIPLPLSLSLLLFLLVLANLSRIWRALGYLKG